MEPPKQGVSRHPGVAATLGRTLAFTLANVLFLLLLSWDAAANGGGGANIGAGLAIMLVTVVAAAVWGGLDGRRCRSATQLTARWGVVAVVASLVTPAYEALVLQTPSLSAFLSAVGSISPFTAALVFVPAVLIGVGTRRARPPAPATRPLTT